MNDKQDRKNTEDGFGCIHGDCENGTGKYVNEFGTTYEGAWKNGLYHGYGILYSRDGKKRYEGQFENNKYHGEGILYYKNGQLKYKGQWKKNKKHGFGIYYIRFESMSYQGEWTDDIPNNQLVEQPVPNDASNKSDIIIADIEENETDETKKIRKIMNDSGISFPVIPAQLKTDLKELDNWFFCNCKIDKHPYNLNEFVNEALSGKIKKDYVLISHTGHGISSYALQYYLVYKNLAMFLHIGFGGVYSDSDKDAKTISNYFSFANQLVNESKHSKKNQNNDRLIVVVSDSYGSSWSPPGQNHNLSNTSNKNPIEVLTEALMWLKIKNKRCLLT